jgi:hypothetical protein
MPETIRLYHKNLVSNKISFGSRQTTEPWKKAHCHLPKRDENKGTQGSTESRSSPLGNDPQQQKNDHILEKEGSSPNDEFTGWQRIEMRVKMKELRSKQGPNGKGVEIAASKVPENIQSLTGREIDLIDLLVKPEHEILDGIEHFGLPVGSSIQVSLRSAHGKIKDEE